MQFNFCNRHRHLSNIFFRCLPNSIRTCLTFSPDSNETKQTRQKSRNLKTAKLKDQLITYNSNQSASIAMDNNQGIIDVDLSSNCSACMKENKGFSSFNSSRERLYNSQPSLAFKYHVGMCMLVFITLAVVMLISELKK